MFPGALFRARRHQPGLLRSVRSDGRVSSVIAKYEAIPTGNVFERSRGIVRKPVRNNPDKISKKIWTNYAIWNDFSFFRRIFVG
jgi:hypothetical protein